MAKTDVKKPDTTPDQTVITPNVSKSSRIKHWLSIEKTVLIVTACISIFGLIRDISSMMSSPEFKHVGIVTINSTLKYNGRIFFTFLINGPIYNPGEKPLFPMHYALEIKGLDSAIKVPAAAVTQAFLKTIEDERVNHMEGLIEKDLRKVSRVNPDDAIYGTLLFFVEGYVLGDFLPDNVQYRIIMTDINDKVYKSEYRNVNDGHDLRYFDDPKLDIIIRDTTKHPLDR
jgi:hypothetical protein